ncbi:MAG: hypothetical protein K2K51_07805 [Bacteroidales bacterium]|nr:hypothetical protein [Bacteroidales bacterium]
MMFEMESKFSMEWLFQECNLHNHCIHLELKVPVVIKGTKTKDVYVLEVIATAEEREAIMKNIAAGINTNNAGIAVRVTVTDKMPITDTVCIGLSTANIKAAEWRNI